MPDGSGLAAVAAEGARAYGGRPMNAIAKITPAAGVAAFAAPGLATAPRKPALARSDWIMAGFRALVMAGPDAIRIEALARELGATKGSFYWHFKDLHALHQAMLQAYEHLATSEITTAIRRAGGTAEAQMLRLADRVSVVPPAEQGGAALEPAVRDWARVDMLARSVMERVDAQRLGDLCSLLAEGGLEMAEAAEGAARFYAAVIGLEALRITCGVDMAPALRAVARDVLKQDQRAGE